MLPDFLTNSYKRYKQETNDFATWLLSTAQGCGFSHPEPLESHSSSSSSSVPGQVKYQVKLSSFVPFARAIADYKPKVSIPSHIKQKGLRIVQLRKKCAGWFTTQTQVSQEAIFKHDYFIETLEETLKILDITNTSTTEADGQHKAAGVEAGTSRKKGKKSTNTRSRVDEALHRYAALQLYEPEENHKADDANKADGATSTAKQNAHAEVSETKAKTPQPQVVVDDVLEGEDEPSEQNKENLDMVLPTKLVINKFLVIFCLLEDLKQTRDFIDQLWGDYKSGKVDLMTAAVVTNTAIDFVRRQCADESLSSLDLANGNRLSLSVYFLLCGLTDLEPHPLDDKGQPDTYNFELHEQVQWCYLDMWYLLEQIRKFHAPRKITELRLGSHDFYDPSRDRSTLSGREQFQDDRFLLLEAVGGFSYLAMYGGSQFPATDQFSNGMIDMYNKNLLPFWLCFAARVWLDIQHKLRPEAATPFKHLLQAGRRIKKTLNDHFEFSEFMTMPMFTDYYTGFVKHIVRLIDVLLINDVFPRWGPPEAAFSGSEHWFLKRHCVLAGTFLFSLNLMIREAGMMTCNAWGSVVFPALLYNEIQNQNLNRVSWPDIEQAISFHSEQSMFGGSRPKNTEESFNKTAAMLDVWKYINKSKFAPLTEDGRQVMLHDSTVVSKILKIPYTEGGKLHMALEDIESLLNDLVQKDESIRSAASSALKLKWTATQKLSPLELLALLREKLMDEERVIVFNYFGLHRRGIELLRLMKNEHHDKFVKYYKTTNYMNQEYQLAVNCVRILEITLNENTEARDFIARVRPDIRITHEIMAKTSKLMAEWVKKNGSVVVKELAKTVTNKHLLDPAKAAENKALGLLDSAYLIPLNELAGAGSEAAMALQMGIGASIQIPIATRGRRDGE